MPAKGTIVFKPGETDKIVAVRLINDSLDEADTETFHVVLSNPVNAAFGPGDDHATGTILDDDPA